MWLILKRDKLYTTLQSQNVWAFISKGIKMPELNRWCMELADYNITFVHIKGKNNVLADAISRLKT